MTSSPSISVTSFAVQVSVSCENGFAGAIETLPMTGIVFPIVTLCDSVTMPSKESVAVAVQVTTSSSVKKEEPSTRELSFSVV